MTVSERERQARAAAEKFLREEKEYRMGYVDAEMPHPLTRRLSQTYAENTEKGVELLFSVDHAMAGRAAKFFLEPAFSDFSQRISQTLRNGGRVIFSGCGSSGRLSMGLERAWREAIEELLRQYPSLSSSLTDLSERVGYLMTGGDFAVIRAVESFEDSIPLGREQARELGLTERDLLVGVTATGETTSILGTAMQALEDGASVWMLICSDPAPICEKMVRARLVYSHPRCRALVLPCGPMALTGSTRMQSSTFEQLVAAAALESALCDWLQERGKNETFCGAADFGAAFLAMTETLLQSKSLKKIAALTEKEQAIYEKKGLVTLFSEHNLLDILTDTTERSPTFMTPPFTTEDEPQAEPSWVYAKNPALTKEEAWHSVFGRAPRCLDWPPARYEALGIAPPSRDISCRGLMRFPIGCEADPRREKATPSLALWVDAAEPSAAFEKIAARYGAVDALTLASLGVTPFPTRMKTMEHLCLKMALNALSTGTMAKMGKITGNWMTCLSISNKKLLDRSARILSDLAQLPYEEALYQILYSELSQKEQGQYRSSLEDAIERLRKKGDLS